MLYRDRNHPCIIAWSLENEEPLQGTVTGTRILETLARTVRKIDPMRPVTAALNHGYNEAGYTDILDVVGYNYGHNYGTFVNDHKQYPHRKIYCSEVSAYAVTRGIYEDDPERGYCSEYGTSWRDNAWLNWLDDHTGAIVGSCGDKSFPCRYVYMSGIRLSRRTVPL
jgi:beta-galactosidase